MQERDTYDNVNGIGCGRRIDGNKDGIVFLHTQQRRQLTGDKKVRGKETCYLLLAREVRQLKTP